MSKLLDKLFLLLVIISSGGMLSVDFSFVKIALVIVFVFLIITGQISRKINAKLIIFISLTNICWIVQGMIYYHDTSIVGGIIRTTLLFDVMLIYANESTLSSRNIINSLYNILLLLTIVSGIIYFIIFIGVNLPSLRTSITRETIFYLQSYVGGNIIDKMWYRNCSVFWEPGLFQIYLNFMLIYALYFLRENRLVKLIHVVIIILSVITTGSIIGYAISAIILGIYIMIFLKNTSLNVLLKICLIMVAIAIIPIFFLLFEKKMNTLSFEYRYSDIINGFKVFLSKPIFGYGIYNIAYETMYYNIFGEMRGSSSGLCNALISFGTIGFGVYMYLFINFCELSKKIYNADARLPLLVWFLLSLFSEPISPMPIVFLLQGMGIYYINSKKNAEYQIEKCN